MSKLRISLKAARVNSEYTLEEISKELNTTAKTVSNWENGNTPIPTNKFYQLCKIYKIDPDFIQVPIVNDGEF